MRGASTVIVNRVYCFTLFEPFGELLPVRAMLAATGDIPDDTFRSRALHVGTGYLG